MRGTIIRDITAGECLWIGKTLKAGTTVYLYDGPTYGCIGGNGIAVSMYEGKNPFFEIPKESVRWDDPKA